MAWCLRPEIASKLKVAREKGSLAVENLRNMESGARRKFFADIVGDVDAEKINTKFERTELLKDPLAGIERVINELTGISTSQRENMLRKAAERAKNRATRIMSPGEDQSFLAELAADRLGVGVSREQAKTIFNMSKRLEGITADSSPELRAKYGSVRRALDNYINEIKLKGKAPKDLKEYLVEGAKDLPGLAKSMSASLDDSAIFRQGWKTIWTNPVIWAKDAAGTFNTIARSLAGKNMEDVIAARLYSRPNSLNGNYKRMGLAIGLGEEAFPTSLPEKLPFIKRFFKASKAAYEGFLYEVRADIADKYIRQAESLGIDMTDKLEAESLGKVINALTGRSNRGIGRAAALNNVFFSPKLMQSNIDMLSLHAGEKMSSFARKKAATNLLKMVAGTAGMLKIADTLMPGSIEWDPRSSDFGKLKIGDTRFDITGGTGQYVTLLARTLPSMVSTASGGRIKDYGGYKSAVTGKVTKFGSGFGKKEGMDMFYDFMENKFAPSASFVKNLVNGKDRDGNPTSLPKEMVNMFTPIGYQNYEELKKNKNAAPIVAAMVADALGIGTNTYSIENNWNNNITKTHQQFRDKVGQEKFDEANKKYNMRVNELTTAALEDPRYKALSEEDKDKKLLLIKETAADEIYKEYKFKYDRAKTDKKKQKLLKEIGT